MKNLFAVAAVAAFLVACSGNANTNEKKCCDGTATECSKAACDSTAADTTAADTTAADTTAAPDSAAVVE